VTEIVTVVPRSRNFQYIGGSADLRLVFLQGDECNLSGGFSILYECRLVVSLLR